MAKKINITAELNAATKEGKIADAAQIYDGQAGKFQGTINKELTDGLENLGSDLQENTKDLPQMREDVATVKESITTLQESTKDLPQMREDVATVKENIITLQENTKDLPQMREDVATVKESIITLQENTKDLPQIREDVAAVKENITTLQENTKDLPQIREDISQGQAELNSVKETVEELATRPDTSTASSVVYDNANSGIPAGNVQEAVDDVARRLLVADREDLEADGHVLRLKDRPSTGGMGYIILRKGKTFAEQMTQANSIYEIRYDFDLGRTAGEVALDTKYTLQSTGSEFYRSGKYVDINAGQTISVGEGLVLMDSSLTHVIPSPHTADYDKAVYIASAHLVNFGQKANYTIEDATIIPPNCTLRFNGGKLSNGTLAGNNTVIDAANTTRIFSDVHINGTWNIGKLYPNWFGAKGDGKTDDTDAIQQAITEAYNIKKEVYIASGDYVITRAIFVYDGITIKGDGTYNSILRTPFGKSSKAKEYTRRDAKAYNTATSPDNVPSLDLKEGHNRFYIGDGSVGYFDGDRDSNPNHPLYYPNDGSTAWAEWNEKRIKVINRGEWIGLTGRENYAEGLVKCSQNPNIWHPTKGLDGYRPDNPQGRVHTGVRNVTISGLKIQTNSSDRGKDTAINFRYDASQIPASIRETYDSSVLNIYISNMYLYSLGGCGISLTRAVDTTIINCYIHQVADRGIYADGVTSINIHGCYANSCLDSGYNLNGVNYSTLNALAADGCGVGYKLNNCHAVSLLSCGAEAIRFTPSEDGEEALYKGRAYDINGCNGVSLISCYGMASRPKLYVDSTDEDAEFYNPEWNNTRFVLVKESTNVDINQCYFKSFGRIRSNAYRDDNNNKVNKNNGTYDPSKPGSRYWQIQNYLIGSIFEVSGETTSVRINGNSDVQGFVEEQEIRWGNLDILDPGIVPNPLASNGVSTANKTLSGADGNGGWTYKGSPIAIDAFEGFFPINAKAQYGTRDYFWEWRDSLILVRKATDSSLMESHPNNYYGFKEFYDSTIDWSGVAEETLNKFKIDIVNDYSDTSFIDGDKHLFTYGKFAYEEPESYTFKPNVTTSIPAIVRQKAEGARTIVNAENLADVSSRIKKAAFGIIGNNIEPSSQKPTLIMGLQSKQKKSEIGDNPILAIEDKNGTNLLEVYANDKLIGAGTKKVISLDSNTYNNIPLLALDASQQTIINYINEIINRLIGHGLMEAQGGIDSGVTFSEVVVLSITDDAFEIQFTAQNGLEPVYNVGVAYSSTSTEPTKNNGSVTATLVEGDTYTALVPRSTTNPNRYIRLYCTDTPTDGSSNRVYSATTYLQQSGDIM